MAYIVNERIIKDFIKLQTDLKAFLEARTITKKQIYEAVGIAKSTLDKKLKDKSFTGDELLEIAQFINGIKLKG